MKLLLQNKAFKLWLYGKFFLVIGVVFLLLELFAPMTFFLSLAVGAIVTAVFASFVTSLKWLLIIFAVAALVSLLLFRPFLRKNNKACDKSGVQEKYIGKNAKAIQNITKSSGAISIYGERWEARVNGDEEILEGSEVKILSNDSLVMYVEKI